jgi:hypothetical protein
MIGTSAACQSKKAPRSFRRAGPRARGGWGTWVSRAISNTQIGCHLRVCHFQTPGFLQTIRSEFSPRKSTSSTSVIEARSAAASISKVDRYRHTAPRRAVGLTVNRTPRASDNVVIVRPSRSAIGTPNLRSQGIFANYDQRESGET